MELYLVIKLGDSTKDELISVCTNYESVLESVKSYSKLRFKHDLFEYNTIEEEEKSWTIIGSYDNEKDLSIFKNYFEQIFLGDKFSEFPRDLYVCNIKANELIDLDYYESNNEGLEYGDNMLCYIVNTNTNEELTEKLKNDLKTWVSSL